MAIPKKNSRLIIIDGNCYRWIVGPNDGYNTFVAEKEGIKGCRIEVYFETDINKLWVEFPYVQELNLRVLKPKDAELIIRQAIDKGWNPDENGKPLLFDLKGQQLIIRSK